MKARGKSSSRGTRRSSCGWSVMRDEQGKVGRGEIPRALKATMENLDFILWSVENRERILNGGIS